MLDLLLGRPKPVWKLLLSGQRVPRVCGTTTDEVLVGLHLASLEERRELGPKDDERVSRTRYAFSRLLRCGFCGQELGKSGGIWGTGRGDRDR